MNDFEKWFFANFKLTEIEDIAEKGYIYGFSSVNPSHNLDTGIIYDTYTSDIWGALKKKAQYHTVELFKILSIVNTIYSIYDEKSFKNSLVLCSLEDIAMEYVYKKDLRRKIKKDK